MGALAPPEDVPFELLEARFGSDSDEDVAETPTPAHAKSAALAKVSQTLVPPTQSGLLQPAVDYCLQQVEDEEDYDEDEEDDEDDEEKMAAAMEWADMRENLAARGTHTTAFHGVGYRPNAQANRASTLLQPRTNNMQKLDSHFHGGVYTSRTRGSGYNVASAADVYDDPMDAFGGHASRVHASVGNDIRAHEAREAQARQRVTVDKSDRATVEQALDPRTRMVLFKMLNKGIFSEINGCVSTGKEANVYHASGGDGTDLAIKVYKTSILVFKDRDRYVSGDFRFRFGYCKSNPRKMVKMWAEKEMRNLARLRAAGIRAPAPVLLRMHVLVMEFIGTEGVAAPRLRDANLPPTRMRGAYTEMVCIIRTLYQKCRLVHADLSEYNILYHEGEIHIIDVSQAVDLDHPKALDFLKEDIKHVNDFFRRKGVATLTVRELFEFTVDPTITDDTLDTALDRLMEIAASRPIGSAEDEVAEAVFAQAFIPKRLDEVIHYERDHDKLQASKGQQVEGIYYQNITGFKTDMSGIKDTLITPTTTTTATTQLLQPHSEQQQQDEGSAPQGPGTPEDIGMHGRSRSKRHSNEGSVQGDGELLQGSREMKQLQGGLQSVVGAVGSEDHDSSDDDSESETESEDDSDDEDGEGGERGQPKDKDAIRAERKANKKAVKEANREKRKAKTPKHVKKANREKAKGGKKKK